MTGDQTEEVYLVTNCYKILRMESLEILKVHFIWTLKNLLPLLTNAGSSTASLSIEIMGLLCVFLVH